MSRSLEDKLTHQADEPETVDGSHERVATSIARQKQPAILDWVKEEKRPVILTHKGTDVAGIVSLSDIRLLDLIKNLNLSAEDLAKIGADQASD